MVTMFVTHQVLYSPTLKAYATYDDGVIGTTQTATDRDVVKFTDSSLEQTIHTGNIHMKVIRDKLGKHQWLLLPLGVVPVEDTGPLNWVKDVCYHTGIRDLKESNNGQITFAFSGLPNGLKLQFHGTEDGRSHVMKHTNGSTKDPLQTLMDIEANLFVQRIRRNYLLRALNQQRTESPHEWNLTYLP